MVSELLIYLSRKTLIILKMKRHKKNPFLVTFPHCKELIFSTPLSSKKYIQYCNYNYYNYNHYCQSTLNYVQKWRVNQETLRSRLFKACFLSFGTMGVHKYSRDCSGLDIPVPGNLRRKGKHNESRSQEECIRLQIKNICCVDNKTQKHQTG